MSHRVFHEARLSESSHDPRGNPSVHATNRHFPVDVTDTLPPVAPSRSSGSPLLAYKVTMTRGLARTGQYYQRQLTVQNQEGHSPQGK